MFITRRHYPGCYRVSNDGRRFGQVKRQGRQWYATIRVSATGDLHRYAGIWGTLADAVAEVEHILCNH